MPGFIKKQVPLLIAGLAVAAPRAASACSVCMGGSDSAATQGLNAAIFTLLATLMVVLGSVAGFIAYLIRRSIKHPLALPGTPTGVAQ
jgi:hypothetical protein